MMGRDSVYKNPPALPEHSRFCATDLFNHVDPRRHAFEQKTHICGSIASALRYNLFSKLISNLANSIRGISIIAYVDDFGAPIPSSPIMEDLSVFGNFDRSAACDLRILNGRR